MKRTFPLFITAIGGFVLIVAYFIPYTQSWGEVAAVFFDVRGPRWRVWSSKELLPDWIGDWTVEIVTAEGEILAAETFTYSPPDP